jgi:hypothetical protein
MELLSKILLEGLTLYKIEVLIKTNSSINQVFIYNEIRGIEGVVVVSVDQNDFLKIKSTEQHHYSLLKIKYLTTSTPKEDIDKIKRNALVTNRIQGLIQFIPRYQTIEKVGQY